MRGSKCQSIDLAPLRGEKLFGPHPQNNILVPFRGSFQSFLQSPPSRLYESSPPPPPPSPSTGTSVLELFSHKGNGVQADDNHCGLQCTTSSPVSKVNTDHPSRRAIAVVCLDRRPTVDNSSGRMIHLKARIYTQTNHCSLPKFVPDG